MPGHKAFAPWFIGDKALITNTLNGGVFVIVQLIGGLAMVARQRDIDSAEGGAFCRVVKVEQLIRVAQPGEKAIGGERYQSQTDRLGIYIGLKDGRFYDTTTGMIWNHDDPELLRRDLSPLPLPVILAGG